MAADLSVDFAGIRLATPFLLASAPPSNPRPGAFQRALNAGWGGAVTRTAPVGGNFRGHQGYRTRGWISRETDFVDKPPFMYAFQNSTWVLYGSADSITPVGYRETIEEAKEAGLPIGVSVAAVNPDYWVELVKGAEEAGADFVEMNMGAAYMPRFGVRVYRDPSLAAEVVKKVKDSCNIPIMIKTNAFLFREELQELARALEAAGADGISVTNTIPGLIGVDIETGKPIATLIDEKGNERGSYGPISGPAIKPFALRAVMDIVQAVNIPVTAIGGISNWESAVEFIMVGAHHVQIGTSAMLYGYGMAKGLVEGLTNFMERKGYSTIEDFRGVTTDKYMADGYLGGMFSQPVRMEVDAEKCTSCGRCVLACESTATTAMRMVKKKAVCNHDICIQCYMCRLVCPEGAVTTRRIEA